MSWQAGPEQVCGSELSDMQQQDIVSFHQGRNRGRQSAIHRCNAWCSLVRVFEGLRGRRSQWPGADDASLSALGWE